MEVQNIESDIYILDKLYVRAFSEYWRIFWKFEDHKSYNTVKRELDDVLKVWPNYQLDSGHNVRLLDIDNESIKRDTLLKYSITNELQRAFEALINASESLDLISSNEELEDIHTSHIKYLMLPFLLSHMLIEKPDMENRIFTLKRVFINLNEFMNTLDKLNVLRKEESEIWRDDTDKSTPVRTNKIQQAKYERELKKGINSTIDSFLSVDQFISSASSADDNTEELCRSTLLNILKLFSIQSLSHLEFIKVELSFLDLRRDAKISKNNTSVSTKKSNAKPWTLRIDPNTKLDPSVVHELYKRMVFVHGHELPSISLEECANIEMEMDVNTIGKTEPPIKRKESGESLYCNSGTDESDAKSDSTDALAEWDDWKDDHPRGMGNKNINVG